MSDEGRPVHPLFKNALPVDAPIWRYLSLAKFAALLQSKCLRFTRIDRFDDHFEGVWPRRDLDAWNKLSPFPAGFTESMRQRVAASCWVNSKYESAGMWRLYAPGTEGVAVRTSFGKLEGLARGMEAAAPGTLAGAARVEYLDHANDSLLGGLKAGEAYPNALLPFMLKHVSYAHENEVRALVVAGVSPEGLMEIEPGGCGTAEIDLTGFLEEVVTNPLSEPWFEQVVVELAKQYGLKAVRRSFLHRRVFWQEVVRREPVTTKPTVPARMDWGDAPHASRF